MPAKTVRDSQRSRVYSAERVLDTYQTPLDDLKAVEKYVRRIEASKRVQAKYRVRRWLVIRSSGPVELRGTRVKDGRGRRSAVSYGGAIAVPRWARKDWVVLHEMAHEFTPQSERRSGAHGWEFCACYLDLVRWFIGKEAHAALKASFKKHRVRFRKPRAKRPLSPEGRAYMAEEFRLRMELAKARKAEAA